MEKVFEGAEVYMSRNLVPPELFAALQDALKLNGAQIKLCCDPSQNGPNQYHVISSPDHEKFEDLRSKGCNLLGPQCVLSCAKEHKKLPKQGYTCCLAMEGVKILASGFEMNEKVEIGKLVTAMGGILSTKASAEVNFVIVKNVLAAKYKWALNILKKPIVTISWLHQCWKEHRVVPQESYKVLPFSGLMICVTRIQADERKEMEKLIIQNGGKYSAELTKKCTHLVCGGPDGDKYKVARRWGHIHIITRKWFDQCVARRACLNEEAYPVQGSAKFPANAVRTRTEHSQDSTVISSGRATSSVATAQDSTLFVQTADPDVVATASLNMSSMFPDVPILNKEEIEPPPAHPEDDSKFDGCVADDSQNEDSDLYLSNCRILLLGFDASEMRKLVNIVRRGGGSRYMSLNEKLTHIVVGTPLEAEIKEVRSLAALGVIYVVRTEWLKDCNREKREVPVVPKHIAYDLLLPQDLLRSYKGSVAGVKQRKAVDVQPVLVDAQVLSGSGMSSKKSTDSEFIIEKKCSRKTAGPEVKVHTVCLSEDKGDTKLKIGSSHGVEERKSSNVFKGKLFRFSALFPSEQRGEIIEWVNEGGGEVVGDKHGLEVHFTIECHGVLPSQTDVLSGTYVSSHWIRSCLKDGHLLDVSSHVLYSPLPCQIPFPEFQSFRLCVSQYDEKERLLLRNLCFTIGTKFVEKLTKKVTHLLCKFSSGPKYEAACKWGIRPVTADWFYECVKQNKVLAPGPFCPREVTLQDREAGLCTLTQYPTQAVRMIIGDSATQPSYQPQELQNIQNIEPLTTNAAGIEGKKSSVCNKKARLFEEKKSKSFQSNKKNSTSEMSPTENQIVESAREVSSAVPDVASAIEDLLEQTSKIQDQNSPCRNGHDESLFASDCPILGQEHANPHIPLGLPKNWINRFEKKEEKINPSGDATVGLYDGFSETQTESQVVGYAEDLSGRQMIIDRVRTRSSMA